jgi:hypothetical protein
MTDSTHRKLDAGTRAVYELATDGRRRADAMRALWRKEIEALEAAGLLVERDGMFVSGTPVDGAFAEPEPPKALKSFWLPVPLIAAIDAEAEARGVPRATVVRERLERGAPPVGKAGPRRSEPPATGRSGTRPAVEIPGAPRVPKIRRSR